MKKDWIWFILLGIVIFDIYHIYFGFESGSITNFFDENGVNEKFKVDESPLMYWLNMGFHMTGIFAVIYISIILLRNKPSPPTTPSV